MRSRAWLSPTEKILLYGIASQFISLFLIPNHALSDDWLCKEAASQRRGSTIIACGIGEADSEGHARYEALEKAKQEFHGICDDSDDCKNHVIDISPLRTECDSKGENHIVCYRAVEFDIRESQLTPNNSTPVQGTNSRSTSVSAPMADSTKSDAKPRGTTSAKGSRLIILSSIPGCVTVDIGGQSARSIKCDGENPKSLLIKSSDVSLQINGPTGFQSARLLLQGSPGAFDEGTEILNVLLQRQ